MVEEDGEVVAWASVGEYSDFPPYADVGEFAIYVADSAQRRGHGRRLLDALCEASAADGRHKLVGKVFAHNEPSRACAASAAFARSGYIAATAASTGAGATWSSSSGCSARRRRIDVRATGKRDGVGGADRAGAPRALARGRRRGGRARGVGHPGAVGILAYDDERVWLVRQPREAVGDPALLEIPAGKLDDEGETPEQTARRELAEEVGVAADDWRPLKRFHTSPGFTDEEATCSPPPACASSTPRPRRTSASRSSPGLSSASGTPSTNAATPSPFIALMALQQELRTED